MVDMDIIAKAQVAKGSYLEACDLEITNLSNNVKCISKAMENATTITDPKELPRRILKFKRTPKDVCDLKPEDVADDGQFDVTAYFALPNKQAVNAGKLYRGGKHVYTAISFQLKSNCQLDLPK